MRQILKDWEAQVKCEVCHQATIQYVVYKGMILCPDCCCWVKYEDAVNPEDE